MDDVREGPDPRLRQRGELLTEAGPSADLNLPSLTDVRSPRLLCVTAGE